MNIPVGFANAEVGFVTLEKILGKPGEQGEVWLAHANGYENVKFAVKISRKGVADSNDKDFIFFQNEFKILSLLKHPNIVKVFACGMFPKDGALYPYYVMEYLGEDVATFQEFYKESKDEEKLSLCLRVLLDTSSALRHVHSQDICHQDIKASNILVCRQKDGGLITKLIDFGFSKLLPTDSQDVEPAKASSNRCPLKNIKPKNLDIWQLAFELSKWFSQGKKFYPTSDKRNWPIDYADFDRLLKLLAAWMAISPSPTTQVESGDIQSFYAEIQDVSRYGSTGELGPDVKGAARYFSVPEIATAAQIQPAFQAVRIPYRQHVLYTERISELITRPEFGVLRYIRQLGFTHLVYPGAQGTRFEHSLGVYNLGCRLVIRMAGQSAFRRACGDPKETIKFLLACLLHDIGHFPLAHQLEEFKGKENDFPNESVWNSVKSLVAGHRNYGKKLIEEDLKGFLQAKFCLNDDDINDILTLMVDREKIKNADYNKLSPSIKFLNNLLSGPTDLDKFDYIERDAHHCGVPYGNFLDVDRVLETMHVLEHDDHPLLAFDRRGIGCLEQVATARHQMFANVYWHRAVRSATVMFKHAFYLLSEILADEGRLKKIFLDSGSDDAAIAAMMKEVNMLDQTDMRVVTLQRLLVSISGKDRILYKEVLHAEHDKKMIFGGDFYENQRKVARRIFKMLKQERVLLSDVDSKGGEHNVMIDCRHDSCPNYNEVKIINEYGIPEDFVKHAPSIASARSDFINQACKIRVFVNPLVLATSFRDKAGRAKIERIVWEQLK